MNIRSIRFRLTVWYTGLLVILLLVSSAYMREVHQPGAELLIYTFPFTERDGKRFLIEVGAPYRQIENLLHGLLLALGLGLLGILETKFSSVLS